MHKLSQGPREYKFRSRYEVIRKDEIPPYLRDYPDWEPFLFLPQQSGFFFQLVFSSLVSALGPDPFHRVVWVRAASCCQVDDCASFAAPDGPEPVDTLEEA